MMIDPKTITLDALDRATIRAALALYIARRRGPHRVGCAPKSAAIKERRESEVARAEDLAQRLA